MENAQFRWQIKIGGIPFCRVGLVITPHTMNPMIVMAIQAAIINSCECTLYETVRNSVDDNYTRINCSECERKLINTYIGISKYVLYLMSAVKNNVIIT